MYSERRRRKSRILPYGGGFSLVLLTGDAPSSAPQIIWIFDSVHVKFNEAHVKFDEAHIT